MSKAGSGKRSGAVLTEDRWVRIGREYDVKSTMINRINRINRI